MNQEDKKRAVAHAALEFIEPDTVLGVGTGSTASVFIRELGSIRNRIDAAVASSEETAARLASQGIRVVDLNAVKEVAVYIDGADEATRHRQLIKGGGGAHTREKIVAAAARRFICIVDDSKLVEVLGEVPVPLEVIPMARGLVARQVVKMGGRPAWREGFVTDNHNVIIDVHDLDIREPTKMERALNELPGVVENGIFAVRSADVLLVGTDAGVTPLE